MCTYVRKVSVVRVRVREIQGTRSLRMPGVEPGSQAWEACTMRRKILFKQGSCEFD